jgi:CTP:molybdopterin cytidylyltransferase MocA
MNLTEQRHGRQSGQGVLRRSPVTRRDRAHLWPALTNRQGDSGASEVLADTTGVELVDQSFPRPIDIDTPDDLERVRRRLSNL